MSLQETLLIQLQENPLNWFLLEFLIYVIYSYLRPVPIARYTDTIVFREYIHEDPYGNFADTLEDLTRDEIENLND
ncbi:hypothetical protein C2G38_2204892 [Gigaspora rosea]|uniref:Uncharacterized protein n=1 Tax=Gigaspora rosea TaxID=44941 RepID=A0A397UKY9_9GLOM|nr:hypothetical protein C2G38_2204892 [Gigaspora rosea]CAG8508979.1 7453_t:CDS:2 [Gigaspora rosea]